MGNNKERSAFWDIFKALGIILVVIGHSGFPNTAFLIIINYFHLSIFFFASGTLYSCHNENTPIDFILKKVRTLLFPLYGYYIFFVLLHNIFINIGFYSTIDAERTYIKYFYSFTDTIQYLLEAVLRANFYEELGGAMWMVLPLFGSIIIYNLIRYSLKLFKLNKSTNEIFILVVTYIVTYLGLIAIQKSIQLPWRFDISLIGVSLISTSYYLTTKHFIRFSKLDMIFVPISLLSLYISYKLGLSISFAAGVVSNTFLYIVSTTSGIYLCLFLASFFEKIPIFKLILSTVGRYSFHIMALHFVAFKLMNIIDYLFVQRESINIAMFPYSNSDFWFLNIIFGILIPILFIKSLRIIRSRFLTY